LKTLKCYSIYRYISTKWIKGVYMGFGNSGGSGGSIAGSNDVALNGPLNTEVLSFDAASSKWKNAATVTQADLTTKQDVSAKGQASGYASLDSATLVPRSQLGTGTATSTSVLHGDGTWSAVAASPVQSVAGKTGAVTLATTDITSGVFDTARLPVSSDTAVGVVELATAAETVTGTDGTRAVTPLGLKSAMTAVTPNVIFVNTLNDVPAGTPVDTLVVVRAA
jgi:hypothetical protein